MLFQDLMNALPRSVAELFHDELDRIVIGPGASREDVLILLQRVCYVIEYGLQYDDPEKTTLVKFVLDHLPKAALDALFPA
jgi:hypothetical protein